MPAKHRLARRLRPLYAAYFFQGFILWYAIEKLFLHGIGFNDTQIAITGILISVSMVVLEIPSGILADRWSRKGVLILASTLLMFATLVAGLSHNTLFYISSVLWGAFAALGFGTYDAVVYDMIEEETGSSEDYEHYYGRLRFYYSLALASGALLSGLTGELLGLRATFWLSMPFIALSIIALLKFQEPTLHKIQTKTSLINHTEQTLKAVFQQRSLVWILFVGILFAVLARLIDNLGSLWYLSFRLPVIYWGPAYALLMMSFGFAGPVATFIKNSRLKTVMAALFIGAATLILTSDASVIAVIIVETILLTGYGVFSILLSHYLHNSLPSHLRAGASSTATTLVQLVFLPTAYLFGQFSDRYSIFRAAWMIVVVTLVGAATFCFKILPRHYDVHTAIDYDAEADTYKK